MSESVERNNYAHPVVVTKECWQGRDMLYVWLECLHLPCDCHVHEHMVYLLPDNAAVGEGVLETLFSDKSLQSMDVCR